MTIMNLFINDLACEASPGQTLGKVARLNHSHVGYVCGGHGVCQACYVTVQEGSECLSPLSEIENAFLSERQIMSGGRLACQATIEKEGTLKVLSRPEEVRRLLLGNPLALFSYGAVMGRDVALKIVPGVQNLAGRIARCEMNGKDFPGDILEAVGAALQLVVTAATQMIPFREQITGIFGLFPSSIPLPATRQFSIKLEPVKLNVPTLAVHPVIAVSVKADKQPEAIDVAALEGIDKEHAIKLVQAGVKSFDQLLERGRDRNGRKELSGATGLGENDVLTLVNRADLARIKGVGFSWSELLEASGVDTVPELAQRNPSNLYTKMQEVNKLKKLVQQLPSVDQVKAWVDQAKKLPRILVY
jgi:chlorosome envelope protein I